MKPTESTGNLAITNDGGKAWTVPAGPAPGGYRSAVTCDSVCIATGTSGSDLSTDGGKSWRSFEGGFNAIGGSFAVGTKGGIATLTPPARQ
jgi:hypothetical protein